MKKNEHPTLWELAKKAGLGTTTVSRVINGGELVDPKTLARVLPSIKVVQQPVEDLGRMAADLLFERLRNSHRVQSVRPQQLQTEDTSDT